MTGVKLLPKHISLIFTSGAILILPPQECAIVVDDGLIAVRTHINDGWQYDTYYNVKEVICREVHNR